MLSLILAGVLCGQPADTPAFTQSVRLPIVSPIPAPTPPTPMPSPNAAQTVAADEWFVIDSDVPLLVLPSPLGRLIVNEDTGPITMRGKFVGGNGIERKTFNGKHVYTIEATHSGPVELLIVPVGATKTADVIRRNLILKAGGDTAPKPTPTPDPKPQPKPSPYVGKWFLIVVEETATAAINRGQYFSDPELKRYLTGRLAERPTVVDKDVIDGKTNKPPADLVPYLDRARGKALPQLYLIGENGEKLLEGDLPPTPAALLDTLRKVGQ